MLVVSLLRLMIYPLPVFSLQLSADSTHFRDKEDREVRRKHACSPDRAKAGGRTGGKENNSYHRVKCHIPETDELKKEGHG